MRKNFGVDPLETALICEWSEQHFFNFYKILGQIIVRLISDRRDSQNPSPQKYVLCKLDDNLLCPFCKS